MLLDVIRGKELMDIEKITQGIDKEDASLNNYLTENYLIIFNSLYDTHDCIFCLVAKGKTQSSCY